MRLSSCYCLASFYILLSYRSVSLEVKHTQTDPDISKRLKGSKLGFSLVNHFFKRPTLLGDRDIGWIYYEPKKFQRLCQQSAFKSFGKALSRISSFKITWECRIYMHLERTNKVTMYIRTLIQIKVPSIN